MGVNARVISVLAGLVVVGCVGFMLGQSTAASDDRPASFGLNWFKNRGGKGTLIASALSRVSSLRSGPQKPRGQPSTFEAETDADHEDEDDPLAPREPIGEALTAMANIDWLLSWRKEDRSDVARASDALNRSQRDQSDAKRPSRPASDHPLAEHLDRPAPRKETTAASTRPHAHEAEHAGHGHVHQQQPVSLASVDSSSISTWAVQRRRCEVLGEQYDIISGESWGTAAKSVQDEWKRNGCDKRHIELRNVHAYLCSKLSDEYKGKAGAGGRAESAMPEITRQVWSYLQCPSLIQFLVPGLASASPAEKSVFTTEWMAELSKLSDDLSTGKKNVTGAAPFLSNESHSHGGANGTHGDDEHGGLTHEEAVKQCQDWKTHYGVTPGVSYGKMPKAFVAIWKKLGCEACHLYNAHLEEMPPYTRTGKEEVVAVCMGTTTRKVRVTKLDDLALFKVLLPSLRRSLEQGFDYRVYLGYDIGDAFFDKAANLATVEAWFKENLADPVAERGISIELRMTRFNNTMAKPGPVFNHILKRAYDEGADWFYRINDDTELCTRWTKPFVTTLRALGPPYGAAGPYCGQGNTKIMTHDFTHRTHMDIFGPYYYPAVLADWWMDDWVSRVYGRRRTRQRKDVVVTHHTSLHSTRYTVDYANQKSLDKELAKGKTLILGYMQKHNNTIPASEFEAFNADKHDKPTLVTSR